MDVLHRSDELIRRGAELRARSDRMRAVASEKRQKSMRVIAARRRSLQPPEIPGGVASIDPGSGERTRGAEGLEAMPPTWEVLVRKSQEIRAYARAARERARQGRSQRKIMQDSMLARTHARLQPVPAIEQAKGIIMSQRQCGPEEAFDLLCQASQRANVNVHMLAVQLAEQVASGSRGDKAALISLREASQLPNVPVRGRASGDEHAAAVNDQIADGKD